MAAIELDSNHDTTDPETSRVSTDSEELTRTKVQQHSHAMQPYGGKTRRPLVEYEEHFD